MTIPEREREEEGEKEELWMQSTDYDDEKEKKISGLSSIGGKGRNSKAGGRSLEVAARFGYGIGSGGRRLPICFQSLDSNRLFSSSPRELDNSIRLATLAWDLPILTCKTIINQCSHLLKIYQIKIMF